MSEYVTLIGAEDVRRAGAAMQDAASSMQSTIGSLDQSLTLHRQYMDEWLSRFEAAVDRLCAAQTQSSAGEDRR